MVNLLACALYVYMACGKSVDVCGSVVGVKWPQLETFVVFIIVTSSSSNSS